MARRSFSSPVMVRKPLEPLNFNECSSPFKPIENEENHSDISLCEMSDHIPELEDSSFRLKKRKSERSLSAPQLLDMFDESNSRDFDCFSKASDDDGFFDEISRDAELALFSSSVPSNFMGLFAGTIMSRGSSTSSIDISEEDKENYAPPKTETGELAKPIFQKPVGLPIYGKNRSKSFSIKRDNPSTDNSPSPVSRKKRPRFIRSQSFIDVNPVCKPLQKPFNIQAPALSKVLHRSQSFDTHTTKSPSVDITSLLDVDDNNLVGDRSRKYCLPISDSKHPDLKGITPETMTDLLNGKYDDEIDEIHIIDCRYPYEYVGGHIKGAVNIYEKSEMYNEFIKSPKLPKDKRQIFVFHCEFSSKRGPSMCRFLRNKDRDAHQHCYPQLYYPEMYLLKGGYKEYFAKSKEQCEPQLYREMDHPDFVQDLKLFSKRSKSWSEGDKSGGRRRTGLRY